MPARIKNENQEIEDSSESMDVLDVVHSHHHHDHSSVGGFGSTCSPLICDTSQSDDLGIESMIGDDLDLEFDFNLQVSND